MKAQADNTQSITIKITAHEAQQLLEAWNIDSLAVATVNNRGSALRTKLGKRMALAVSCFADGKATYELELRPKAA